ncbi:zinc finger protein 665-like [Scleropages formosus]|uniref:zinc finger protein 665-like n=1 Tax=Scleropages formosus TaxID=113540 RepID=UPI0010FA8499|nr:zinc finger protein 665-like [Scleropages formosus]XP_018608391.2 zinc finger protein 665-like [Scleropages formosus]
MQCEQLHCPGMMECPQRSLQVLELRDVRGTQELPEKDSVAGMLLEASDAEQELFEVQIVSIKEELSDVEEAKDGPYLEVSCSHVKEETLKPIHVHRVFPVFGLFSDTESELPDQHVECAQNKEEALKPIHVHRVFSDFGLLCDAQSDDQSGTSGDKYTEDSGNVSSTVPDYSGLWGLSSLPQLSLFSDENCESIQSRETSRMSSSTASDCSRGTATSQHPNNFSHSKHLEADHRPYLCSICGKTFRRRYHLKSHLSVHLGEKPFHCTRCDKRFTMHRSLERHQQQCTGQVNRRCPFCGDIFRNLSHLQGHMVIHNAEKSFQCSRCGQHYRQSDYLKRHQGVLTEDPPCYCLECEKTLRLLAE